MSTHTYVLYHANCFDGMGAAWAVWKAIRNDNVTYIPCYYADRIKGPVVPEMEEGSAVYMVDYSMPRAVLTALSTTHPILVVLDHHKTAEEDLRGFPGATFDMQKSGAVLAWEYFHPGITLSPLLDYIQDRDLWRFALPRSQEINAWIQSHPRTFEAYDEMANYIESDRYAVIQEGGAILRYMATTVAAICGQATCQSFAGYGMIPVVNTSCLMSEVGHELLERNPSAPFVGYYFNRHDGKRQWGLRSRRDFDCSVVAKARGGGGHQCASGFVEDINEAAS